MEDASLAIVPIHYLVTSTGRRPLSLPDPSRILSSGSEDITDGGDGLGVGRGDADRERVPLLSDPKEIKFIPRPNSLRANVLLHFISLSLFPSFYSSE